MDIEVDFDLATDNIGQVSMEYNEQDLACLHTLPVDKMGMLLLSQSEH